MTKYLKNTKGQGWDMPTFLILTKLNEDKIGTTAQVKTVLLKTILRKKTQGSHDLVRRDCISLEK